MGELSGKGRRSMDRRKIRVILDALLAAVLVVGMCGALAGCGSGQGKAEAERLDETAEAEDVSDGAVGDDGRQPGDVSDGAVGDDGQQPGDVSGAEAGGDMSDADDGQKPGNISGEGVDSENAVSAEDAEGGNGFAQGNENGAEEAVSPFAGKTVSICGDSISTFTGYIPDYYSKFYPEMGEITRVEDTWWMQVLERTGMELCRNASYSGSTVSGQSQDNGDGRFACGNCRVLDLAGDEGEDPDVILILMGANDLLTDIPLGAYDGVSPVEEGYIKTFSEAYALMLDKMLERYPQTEIYCCTIAEVGRWNEAGEGYSYTNVHSTTAKDYNAWIKAVANAKGVSVIDVYECGITAENIRQYTSDGTHPNPAGAKLIADKVCQELGVN